jgi:hypothetical protein
VYSIDEREPGVTDSHCTILDLRIPYSHNKIVPSSTEAVDPPSWAERCENIRYFDCQDSYEQMKLAPGDAKHLGVLIRNNNIDR